MTAENPGPPPTRGLRLQDLVGLIVGYGMAALLARSFWRGSRPMEAIPAVAMVFDFCWLGLAMSGPIVLLFGREGGAHPWKPRQPPERPGRPISEVRPPVGRGPVRVGIPEPGTSHYTKPELAWMVIGGYWISLTMFVVPAMSVDTPWALIGLLQVVAGLALWAFVPGRPRPGSTGRSWTHHAALGLLWTWPFAWIFLILLGRSL